MYRFMVLMATITKKANITSCITTFRDLGVNFWVLYRLYLMIPSFYEEVDDADSEPISNVFSF